MTEATATDAEVAEEIREDLRKACDMADFVPSGIFDSCACVPMLTEYLQRDPTLSGRKRSKLG